MKEKEFLKKIVSLAKITDEQCDELEVICIKYHISYERKSNCDSAWREAAMMAYNEIVRQAAEKSNIKKLYILRGDVDVVWEEQIINAETLTDENATELLAAGFPEKFFIKINGEMTAK